MKPQFSVLATNYSSNRVVSKDDLFKEIGWDDLTSKTEYNNTCAIRVSLALVKSGISVQGRMKITRATTKGN